MFKVCVFLFLCFIVQIEAQVCAPKKDKLSCVCKRVTYKEKQIVTEADCSRTNLEKIPQLNQLISDLQFLDLSHNYINSIEETFACSTLKILDLSYNRINALNEAIFSEIENVEEIVLSHNNISSLDSDTTFTKCQKLLKLDLSFNNIKTLQENIFLPLVDLQFLDLSYNDKQLGQWLSQTKNSLMDLGLNPNISTLNLEYLGLKDLHNLYFSNFTNLKHLSLANNELEQVPRIPYSVEYFDISGSAIAILQAKELSYHSLKVLKMNQMKQLTDIHHYAFYSLLSLEELSIRNCRQLQEFNELVFGALHKDMKTSLKKLSLSGNALQRLNSSYKYLFKNLDSVDLGDNPWKCDCDLLWLQEFNNLYKSDRIRCSSPSKIASKKLIDLTYESIPSCYPQRYGKSSHRITIVVLILLVLILISLVGYLIYYSPNWYNRGRGISLGPQSPYNPTSIQED